MAGAPHEAAALPHVNRAAEWWLEGHGHQAAAVDAIDLSTGAPGELPSESPAQASTYESTNVPTNAPNSAPTDAPPHPPDDPALVASTGSWAEEAAATPLSGPDLHADPDSAPQSLPSFVRSAEQAARWRRPRVRATLALLCLAALLTLASQTALEYRDLLAAQLPQTRPWLEAACKPLGCKIEAARVIDSLAVDSSGLLRIERSNLYKLQVSLRNRAGIALAVPALDMKLTDSQGRLIARKVLLPADLGVAQATIDAGRDLHLQATLQSLAGGDAGVPVIAGYTIELFYP